MVFYPDIISKWAERIPFLPWKCLHSVRRVTIVLLSNINGEVVITRKYSYFKPFISFVCKCQWPVSENLSLCKKRKKILPLFCILFALLIISISSNLYENCECHSLNQHLEKLSFSDANVTFFIVSRDHRLNIAVFYYKTSWISSNFKKAMSLIIILDFL